MLVVANCLITATWISGGLGGNRSQAFKMISVELKFFGGWRSLSQSMLFLSGVHISYISTKELESKMMSWQIIIMGIYEYENNTQPNFLFITVLALVNEVVLTIKNEQTFKLFPSSFAVTHFPQLSIQCLYASNPSLLQLFYPSRAKVEQINREV